MPELIAGLIILVLLIIAYQDFKEKLISLVLVIGLGLLSSIYSIMNVEIELFLENTLLNFAIIGFVSFVLLSYFKFIKRSSLVELKESFGLGDLLFIFCISLLFSPIYFIVFNVLGFIAGLIYYALNRLLSKSKNQLIPLAGIMAILLAILHLLNYFVESNLFINNYLYSQLIWL